MARYVGGKAVAAPLREANDFRMDVDEVASLITPRTKLLITNSPHNPTGSILTDADTRRLAELAVEHDLVVLADEIYMRLQYSGEPLSIATLPGMAERTITLDGFSKTFAMTGWRLGYGIVPEWLGPAFSRLVINSVSCTNAFAQLGAVEALTGPQDAADAMRVVNDRARVLTVKSESSKPNGIAISVADSGVGIDPKNMERIFDTFFTTKSDGMGIGLAICRSIVDRHGGTLSVSPSARHGSVFRVVLPGST